MIECRRAVLADAEAIAAVNVRSWRTAYRGLMPDEFLDGMDSTQIARLWRDALQNPDADVFVVENATPSVVGFALLVRDTDTSRPTGEIVAIYIDPEHWRSGLGSVLVDSALMAAAGRGFEALVLWVLVDNRRGRAFYESRGFVATGAERNEHRWGTPLKELRYRRALQSS